MGAGGCCVDKDKKNMDASLRWKEQLLLKEKLLLEKKAFLEHRISKAKRAIAVFEEPINSFTISITSPTNPQNCKSKLVVNIYS